MKPLEPLESCVRIADDTDRRILDAAIARFSRDGYHSTTVASIAMTAGVGHGTVFRRFETKERLFSAALGYCLDSASAYVRQKIDAMTDPLATLRAIARLRAEYCSEHPEMIELMMIECAEFRTAIYLTHLRGRHGNLDFVTDLMRRAALKNRPATKPEAFDAAVAFMDLTFGAAVNGYFDGDRERLVERTESAVELFLRGWIRDAIDRPPRQNPPRSCAAKDE